jgi:tetratricopeptide (TPR) repeat protein
MLALSLLYSGDKRDAWSTIQQLIGDAPTYAFGFYAAAHVAMAYALKERKWYDFGAKRELKVQAPRLRRARAFILEALRLEPTNAFYLATFSLIEAALGRWGASLDAAERGLAADPRHIECGRHRAKALLVLGDRAQAERTIDTVISVDPEAGATHAARGWHRLAAGDRAGAENHFREALSRNPSDRRARFAVNSVRAARFAPVRGLLQLLLWASNGLVRPLFASILIFGAMSAGAFQSQKRVVVTTIAAVVGMAVGVIVFRPALTVYLMFDRASRRRIPVRQFIISILILLIIGGGWLACFCAVIERERSKNLGHAPEMSQQ